MDWNWTWKVAILGLFFYETVEYWHIDALLPNG